MTDYKHLRELAEAADQSRDVSRESADAWEVYLRAADPQTVIALLDELKRVTEQRDELNRMHRECHAQRDALQARIDAALAYIDDPGNWGTYDGRRRLLHDLLSTPAENGEEDA